MMIELNILQLIGCFMIGCATWDVVKYLFRKAMESWDKAVNFEAARIIKHMKNGD